MLPRHVVQSVKYIVLGKILRDEPVNYLSIKNRIQDKYSIKLSDNDIFLIRNLTDDLKKTLTQWAPVLHLINSDLDRVEPSSEPREY